MWKRSSVPYFLSFVFSFFLVALYSILPQKSLAGNMQSDSYFMIFGNINIGGNEHKSSSYTLDSSLGQTAAERFKSSGYIVRAGFQYIHILYPFSFSLSDTSIDFGTILPNVDITRQLTVGISNRGQGYEVGALADHTLRRFSLEEINDTGCNGGNDLCSVLQAALWNSSGSYGFGYNASGHDVSSDFVNSNYYRPFANRVRLEQPAVFMFANRAVKNRRSTITMKINTNPVQPAGTYQTVIDFIAVPKY